VQSLIPITEKVMSSRKTLHIIETSILDGNEVLVNFSDGTAAIYEMDELEKLRPAPKKIVEDRRVPAAPLYANAS
jgi:hypothetical protein